jgi:hypothetical protein
MATDSSGSLRRKGGAATEEQSEPRPATPPVVAEKVPLRRKLPDDATEAAGGIEGAPPNMERKTTPLRLKGALSGSLVDGREVVGAEEEQPEGRVDRKTSSLRRKGTVSGTPAVAAEEMHPTEGTVHIVKDRKTLRRKGKLSDKSGSGGVEEERKPGLLKGLFGSDSHSDKGGSGGVEEERKSGLLKGLFGSDSHSDKGGSGSEDVHGAMVITVEEERKKPGLLKGLFGDSHSDKGGSGGEVVDAAASAEAVRRALQERDERIQALQNSSHVMEAKSKVAFKCCVCCAPC